MAKKVYHSLRVEPVYFHDSEKVLTSSANCWSIVAYTDKSMPTGLCDEATGDPYDNYGALWVEPCPPGEPC